MKADICCTVCTKPVKSNQRGTFCDCCLRWIHAKCILLSNSEYSQLGRSNEPWFCSFCLQRIFPFNHISDDTEFLLAIGDRVDYHALNFNPFFDNENRYLLNSEDLDLDINYYNNISLPDTVYKLPSDLMSQTSEKSSSSLLTFRCCVPIVEVSNMTFTSCLILSPLQLYRYIHNCCHRDMDRCSQ